MNIFHVIGYWWLAITLVGFAAATTYILADFIGAYWWRRMCRLRDVYVLNWWIESLKAHGFTVPTKANMEELLHRIHSDEHSGADLSRGKETV